MSDPTTTTTTTTTDPCEPCLPTDPQDAARSDAAPPGPGREQIMNGLIWSAMCLTEDAAHKLYDCDVRRVTSRGDIALQSAIADLRAALAYLTGEDR